MAINDIQTILQSYQIVGRSPLLLQAVNAAVQAAPYDVNVLVFGENGVGKEVFHKIIHNNSSRKFKKCIAVNCGGLPEGTIDSELFGHVKGAFTGALNDRKGYFEEANGGTIFLDEIGELPLATQAKLLRVIESGEYYRMGSGEIKSTDVRIIAATNVDLQKAIRKGTFREDLYYRLSTITINIPALRERQEDINLLFNKFAGDVADKYRMPAIQLDANARMMLSAFTWPGNIRQLLHVVEHISIVERERLITKEILAKYLPAFDSGMSVHEESNTGGRSFAPGEKEMLYKVVFNMKEQLEEVRKRLGMQQDNSNDSYTQHALPAAKEEVIDMEGEEVAVPAYSPASPNPTAFPNTTAPTNPPASPDKPQTLEAIEREAIKNALDRNAGNKRKAAEELGISERTIHRKIQDYNL